MIINGTNGPDFLVGTSDNDQINGFRAGDILVGDFYTEGDGDPDVVLQCQAGIGGNFDPTNEGGNGNVAFFQNDVISDGRGNDIVAGDAFLEGFGDLWLNSLAGTGGFMGGPGGNGNVSECFNDEFVPDRGNDVWAGDLFYEDGPGDVEMNAAAGSVGFGGFASAPHGPGGDGGNGNVVDSFNDFMPGESTNRGDDVIVGDILSDGPEGTDELLTATAGSAGAGGGDGGDDNVVDAFNDAFIGDRGEDIMVGDVLRTGGFGDTSLDARAGRGGDNAGGGTGGDDNVVDAFNDALLGNRHADMLVGDVYLDGGPNDDLELSVSSGGIGFSGGGTGGQGNVVSAYNDALSGGNGADFIIGDAANDAGVDQISVVANGTAGNTLEAFRDTIDGGRGADLIFGDFLVEDPCEQATVSVVGTFTGIDELFGDTIAGGRGHDTIYGGFGADVMAGNQGNDTFVFLEADLFDPTGANTPPVDVIVDFEQQGNDTLDFRPLLECLGFDPQTDDINDWLILIGPPTDSFIAIDQTGSGVAHLPMLELQGFPPAGLDIDTLVANGDLLI